MSTEAGTPAHRERLLTVGNSFDISPYLRGDCELKPFLVTDLGALFEGDCLDVLKHIRTEVADAVFADPPFNLGKDYGPRTHDLHGDDEYLRWCQEWISECVRVLRPGGSFFLYNLPKWNVLLGGFLHDQGMMFRHWIAVDVPSRFPIPGRLYPAHYSLLYYTKGKPTTFRRIRVPIELCRHCGKEVKDYGGHRRALNERGTTLKDIWTDIPPVRHRKFKSAARNANALSTKLLDRVVEISTQPGDLVLDPFGGSGTTFDVCEKKHRRWLGIELNSAEVVADRLLEGGIAHHRNDDYVEG